MKRDITILRCLNRFKICRVVFWTRSPRAFAYPCTGSSILVVLGISSQFHHGECNSHATMVESTAITTDIISTFFQITLDLNTSGQLDIHEIEESGSEDTFRSWHCMQTLCALSRGREEFILNYMSLDIWLSYRYYVSRTNVVGRRRKLSRSAFSLGVGVYLQFPVLSNT